MPFGFSILQLAFISVHLFIKYLLIHWKSLWRLIVFGQFLGSIKQTGGQLDLILDVKAKEYLNDMYC